MVPFRKYNAVKSFLESQASTSVDYLPYRKAGTLMLNVLRFHCFENDLWLAVRIAAQVATLPFTKRLIQVSHF